MNTRTEGWSRLDAMIAEDGEGGVLERVMTRIAIGENPRDIALSMGMPWLVLRRWLEDKPERMREWELADRCFADELVYEALSEVRGCGVDEVSLVKLRSEHYDRKAGRLNRAKWGEKAGVEVNSVQVDVRMLTMDELKQMVMSAIPLSHRRVPERLVEGVESEEGVQ